MLTCCGKLAGIVEVSVAQIELLESHYELLLRWNQTLNLTRIENLEEALERHYGESLFLAAGFQLGLCGLRILDRAADFRVSRLPCCGRTVR